jgi:hypothetical protein
MCLGAFLFFFLADGPASAKWLRKDDRPFAVARVAASGVGVKTTGFNWKHGLQAVYDPKNWLLTLAMFGSSVPNGVLTSKSSMLVGSQGR